MTEQCTLSLRDDELAELERLLEREVRSTLVEVRRCDNRAFRADTERRLKLIERILGTIRQVRQDVAAV